MHFSRLLKYVYTLHARFHDEVEEERGMKATLCRLFLAVPRQVWKYQFKVLKVKDPINLLETWWVHIRAVSNKDFCSSKDLKPTHSSNKLFKHVKHPGHVNTWIHVILLDWLANIKTPWKKWSKQSNSGSVWEWSCPALFLIQVAIQMSWAVGIRHGGR